jgi:hypothetical protein
VGVRERESDWKRDIERVSESERERLREEGGLHLYVSLAARKVSIYWSTLPVEKITCNDLYNSITYLAAGYPAAT